MSPSTGDCVMMCPECDTVFLRHHGNQKYCTPPCQRRYAHRRYRLTHRMTLRQRVRKERTR